MALTVWVVTREEGVLGGREEFKAVYSTKQRALDALETRALTWVEDDSSQSRAEDPTDPLWSWYVAEIEVDDSTIL